MDRTRTGRGAPQGTRLPVLRHASRNSLSRSEARFRILLRVTSECVLLIRAWGTFGSSQLCEFRSPRGLPARSPSAPRAFGSARRLEARPGPAGLAAASNRAVLGVLRWCSGRLRARPPARSPHASFARSGRSRSPPVPSGPSGALHTGGVAAASHRAELSAAGWSAQALPQSRCAARARRLARTEESSQSALRHASAHQATPIAIQRNVGTVSWEINTASRR